MLRKVYFLIYKNRIKQCYVVALLLLFIFFLISNLLNVLTGGLVMVFFLLAGLLVHFFENGLKEYFTLKNYIILFICWFFFLVYTKSYIVLLVYFSVALTAYIIHGVHNYYLKSYRNENTVNKELTVVETVFLDFRTIENHFRDDFPIFLLLRKTHVLTFLVNFLVFAFAPSFYTYTAILDIGVGFLLLWWVDMLFFFFIRYQIISFCNVVVKLPIFQKTILVVGGASIGSGTGLLGFHIATTTPGFTPFPSPVTGLWQNYVLGYKAITSAQLILAQMHTVAYPGELVPVNSAGYVDSVVIHSKLATSASEVANGVNDGLPWVIKGKGITSDIFKKIK
jgi:hypothetical protein